MNSLQELLNDIELKEAILHESMIAEEILQLLDMIHLETTHALNNHNHKEVMAVLTVLIKFDGKLRDIIYLRSTANDTQDNEVFEYLELQSQVNTFRNKLLEEIIHYLCDRYEHARQLAKLDPDIATKIFKINKNINDFYINGLLQTFEAETLGQDESYRKKTCLETISTLEEVSNIALKKLHVLAQK